MEALSDFGYEKTVRNERILSALVYETLRVPPGDEVHEEALDSCLHQALHHRFADTEPRQIEKLFAGLEDRFGSHAQYSKQRALGQLTQALLAEDLASDTLEVKHRLLAALYWLARSPINAIYEPGAIIQALQGEPESAREQALSELFEDDDRNNDSVEQPFSSGDELSDWEDDDSRASDLSPAREHKHASTERGGPDEPSDAPEWPHSHATAERKAPEFAWPSPPAPKYTNGCIFARLAALRCSRLPFMVPHPSKCTSQQALAMQVISMLRGSKVPGAAFSWDASTGRFFVAPDIHVPHMSPGLLRHVLEQFAISGSIAVSLHQAVAKVQGSPDRLLAASRPTHAAFVAALATQLRAIDAQLVAVEQQAARKDQLDNLMHLQDVLQGAIRQLQVLQSVWQAAGQYQGFTSPADQASKQLTALYTSLHQSSLQGGPQGKEASCIPLKLLTGAMRPCLEALHAWLHNGLLPASHSEFFIAKDTSVNLESRDSWDKAYSLRRTAAGDVACPEFLQPLAESILASGKSLLLLRDRPEAEHRQQGGTSRPRSFSAVEARTGISLYHSFLASLKAMVEEPKTCVERQQPDAGSAEMRLLLDVPDTSIAERMAAAGAASLPLYPLLILPSPAGRTLPAAEASAPPLSQATAAVPPPAGALVEVSQQPAAPQSQASAAFLHVSEGSPATDDGHGRESGAAGMQPHNGAKERDLESRIKELAAKLAGQALGSPDPLAASRQTMEAVASPDCGQRWHLQAQASLDSERNAPRTLAAQLSLVGSSDAYLSILGSSSSLQNTSEQLGSEAEHQQGSSVHRQAESSASEPWRSASSGTHSASSLLRGAPIGLHLGNPAASTGFGSVAQKVGPKRYRSEPQSGLLRALSARSISEVPEIGSERAAKPPMRHLSLPPAGQARRAALDASLKASEGQEGKAGDAHVAADSEIGLEVCEVAGPAGITEELEAAWSEDQGMQAWAKRVLSVMQDPQERLQSLLDIGPFQPAARLSSLTTLTSFTGSAAGQLWDSGTQQQKGASPEAQQWLDLLAEADLPPVQVLMQCCLLAPIQLQAQRVGSRLLSQLMGPWQLRQQLAAMRNLFLGGSAAMLPFVLDLVEHLASGLCLPDIPTADLQACLEDNLPESTSEEPLLPASALSVHMKMPDKATEDLTTASTESNQAAVPAAEAKSDEAPRTVEELQALSVECSMAGPLSLVLDSSSLSTYNSILVFLIKLQWARHTVRRGLSAGGRGRRRARADLLGQRLLHLVNSLQQYAMYYLADAWQTFQQALDEAATVDDVKRLHRRFLQAAAQPCMASSQVTWRVIYDALRKMLDLCLRFAELEADEQRLIQLEIECQDRMRYLLKTLVTKTLKVGDKSGLSDFVLLLNYNGFYTIK